jgi:hypothetical protein
MALSTKNRNDKNERTGPDDRRAAKTATTNRQYRDCVEKNELNVERSEAIGNEKKDVCLSQLLFETDEACQVNPKENGRGQRIGELV